MTKVEYFQNDLADGERIDGEPIEIATKQMKGKTADGNGGISLKERNGTYHTSREFLEELGFDLAPETDTISIITHERELLAIAEHGRFEWDITSVSNVPNELQETIEEFVSL